MMYKIKGIDYTMNQLERRTRVGSKTLKIRLSKGAKTLHELTVGFNVGVGYKNSMFYDKNNHWKLLARALKV